MAISNNDLDIHEDAPVLRPIDIMPQSAAQIIELIKAVVKQGFDDVEATDPKLRADALEWIFHSKEKEPYSFGFCQENIAMAYALSPSSTATIRANLLASHSVVAKAYADWQADLSVARTGTLN